MFACTAAMSSEISSKARIGRSQFHELDFHILAIDVAIEVGDMDLAGCRGAIGNVAATPTFTAALIALAINVRICPVHAIGKRAI